VYEPELLTTLIGESVPAFRAAGIRVSHAGDGEAAGVLPLTEASTNQHGTHQATLIGLLGDYVGGVAVGSLFPSTALVGIHPARTQDSAMLWLASFELKFLRPSCADLEARAAVPAEQKDDVRARFARGEALLLPLTVRFTDDRGEPVAEGTFVYFLRHSAFVAPRSPKPAGVMHSHLSKSSARLVANLRAREADRPRPLFEDPWSDRVAGQHGRVMGDRFLAALPELQRMIAARTRHLDDCLRAALNRGVRQVALVGSGLDCRPARFAPDWTEVTWFELDLPHMLDERERAMAPVGLPAWERVPVPFNLLTDDPLEALGGGARFRADQPVFVVYEGCSMYFAGDDAARILAGLARLVQRHPDSRWWLDFVSTRVAAGQHPEPSVTRFLDQMARLGEPFVFGLDAAEGLADAHALRVEAGTHAGLVAGGALPLFEEYRFALLAPGTGATLEA
jgi:methyltransferase (TIGR00027 family)